MTNHREAVEALKPTIDVKLRDGINHNPMGIVTNPKAVSAGDIPTRGDGQS